MINHETSKVRIFDSLHSKLHIKTWRNQQSIARLFHHLLRYLSNQISHQSVDVFCFLHTKSIQRMQRLHHKHIVYYFVYIFSISNLLHEILINYRFNDFDFKYFALIYKRHQVLNIFIHIKNLKKAKSLKNAFFTRFSFLLWDFWFRISRNDVSQHLIASIIAHVLMRDFELRFENVFVFFSVY